MTNWFFKTLETGLKPLIPLSYGSPGFKIKQKNFAPEELQVDMTGKICLVTGANSGIGFETALAFAQKGAEVWLLCRNEQRGEAAREKIVTTSQNQAIHLAIVDMSERSSIREFCTHFPRPQIDILVQNAAVMPDEHFSTSDGLELTLATNLVGPFLLTQLLLPKLRAAKAARVILVSSGGMYAQKLDLHTIETPKHPFDGVIQYAQTKRAMVILNELWASRYPNDNIDFHCMHPGWGDTPAVRSSLPRFWKVTQSILRTPEQAADTVIWLGCAPSITGLSGHFWFDRGKQKTHILPWTRESEEVRAELWEKCCFWSGWKESVSADKSM
mgnify:CR=1 FL=1